MNDTLYFDDWNTGSNLQLPSFSSPSGMDGLKAIGSAIGDVVDYGLKIQNQIYDTQSKADNASFNRFLQSVQLDTAKTLATTQGETAKIQAQAALAKAQQQFNYSSGLTGLNNAIGGNGVNKLMIALAIAGVVIAVMQLKK